MESEILALIDQLEALCSAGSRVPLSSRVMVPSAEVFRLLDQMRQSLPREIIRARHIYQERDHIFQEAQTDAEAMRAAARAERAALIADHSITIEAIASAEMMKREALAERDRLRQEADAYALASLHALNEQLAALSDTLDATRRTVEGGIELLESRAHNADLLFGDITQE